MRLSARLVQFSVMIILSSTVVSVFWFSTMPKESENPMPPVSANLSQNTVDVESDQSFSGTAGSTIEYNIYIWNRGKTSASYTLTALSNKGYDVEVWRDTDQIGSGDVQLIPPQGSILTMSAGEVATLIVKVAIPSGEAEGTVDTSTVKAVNTASGASDSVTITTTVASNLPYPSNWIQLGSDPTFPIPPPERIDAKALYYTNNGLDAFFRMAEVSAPNTIAFKYFVYLDTKAGGQQIGSYSYDYLLSSDGTLYEWNGMSWINSGYSTQWQVDGTGIVLWTDLNNLSLELQEIHILARIVTKDNNRVKDQIGPYVILRNSISEAPLILIPVLSVAIFFTISRRTKKNAPMHEYFFQAH